MCLKGAVRVWRGGFLLEEYKCLSFNCSKNEYDVICVRASIGDRANAGFGGFGGGGTWATNLRLRTAGIPGQTDERRGHYYVTPYWERPWLL